MALPVVGPEFSQQGSVDWVDLTTKSLSFPIEVLGRISNANVNPLTIVVGQVVATKFRLGPVGSRNIHKALSGLASYGSFGKIIWFGFGIKSLVRTLGQTSEGVALLALCTSVGECFQEDFAAEFLHHMAQSYKAPEELTPSTFEWLALLRSCSGLLSATEFPMLAEQLISYFSSHDTGRRLAIGRGRGFLDLNDLSSVFIALCKVTCKESAHICIRGGPSCGWLAAIAVWLLDLTISISDGDMLLYSNIADGSRPQVEFTCSRARPGHDTNEIELISETYYLRDSNEFIYSFGPDAFSDSLVTISGRIHWNECLSSTFGSEFQLLMETSRSVGVALGCVARIFLGIARMELEINDEIIKKASSVLLFEASVGRGFAHHTVTRFPELEPLRTFMESGAKESLGDSLLLYEQNMAQIEQRCPCPNCKLGPYGRGEPLCLAAIFETIIFLSLTLSVMLLPGALCPTRAGMELVYSRQNSLRGIRNHSDEVKKRMTKIGKFISFIAEPRQDIIGQLDMTNRMQTAIEIFTGRLGAQPETLEGVSALSTHGLCFYLDTLRESSIDGQFAGRLHAIPGKIERHGRLFDRVIDRLADNSFTSLRSVEAIASKTFSDKSVLCVERARSLSIGFTVLEQKSSLRIEVCPAHLCSLVQKASLQVNCLGRPCPQTPLVPDTGQEIQVHELHGKVFHISRVDRWRKILLFWLLQGEHKILICLNQCLQCCVRHCFSIENEYDLPFLILL